MANRERDFPERAASTLKRFGAAEAAITWFIFSPLAALGIGIFAFGWALDSFSKTKK